MKISTMFKSLACLAVAAAALLAPCTAEALTIYRPAASTAYKDYVYVSWRADSSATQFRVYRSTTKNFSNAVSIGTFSRSTRAVRDWTAKLGVKYYYWIASRYGNTFYYASSLSDYGYRLMSVTLVQKWANSTTRRWIGGYANGTSLPSAAVSWTLSKSGVGTWKKYRSGAYIGYFSSNKRGTTKWKLTVGTTAPVTFSKSITWR